MAVHDLHTPVSAISVREGLSIYAAFLLSFMIVLHLTIRFAWFPVWVALIAYVLCGFVLNRVVLRRLVEWHPMYNALYSMSSAKLRALVLWPLSYAGLLCRLAITKIL